MNITTDSLMNSTVFDLLSFNDTTAAAINVTDATIATTAAYDPRAPGNMKPLTDTFYFTRVYNYLAFATGIPGNILTVIILARMRPVNSVQVWLTGLSCVDLFTLINRASITPYQSFKHFGYYHELCIYQYTVAWTCEYSNYLFFLSMTVERFIAVWFPLRMSSWTSPKRAAIGVVSIFTCCLMVQLHHIWTFTNTKGGCTTKWELYWFWNDIWVDIVETILVRAFPLFATLLLNILIMIRLGMNKGIKKSLSDDQAKEKQKQQRQINRLLTVATVFFFVSLLPDIVQRLTSKLWGDPWNIWLHARNIGIAINAFAALRTGNHAGNFYCYILVARKFRNELIHLVTCGRYGEHNGVKGRLVKTPGLEK